MFNFLLDKTSPDNIPDGYASGNNLFTAEFCLGIFIGLLIAFFIWGMASLLKSSINDFKNPLDENKKDDQ